MLSKKFTEEAALTYCDENIILDDIGFVCDYNGTVFTINFNLSESVISTFTKNNIILEPVLWAIEEMLEKSK